jgi:OOP family OmpA-OmpF porin
MDTDGDGVFDDKDQCPGTASGAAVDAVGCVRKGSITLAGVNFENNSARLLPESLTVLDVVAADLKRYPRLKVEVQGHTDSVGSDVYNQKLSQSRAESVRERLVSQGVDAAQLSAKGYGEARPVTSNATPEGRSQNRRVAMQVLDNPGDVEVSRVVSPNKENAKWTRAL